MQRDAGIYGMAGLICEMGKTTRRSGSRSFPASRRQNGGAAVLGAPLMHDFAVISLSDLMTPWEKIAQRLRAAAEADFVICLYNPSSRKRADYFEKACGMILESRRRRRCADCAEHRKRRGEL